MNVCNQNSYFFHPLSLTTTFIYNKNTYVHIYINFIYADKQNKNPLKYKENLTRFYIHGVFVLVFVLGKT